MRGYLRLHKKELVLGIFLASLVLPVLAGCFYAGPMGDDLSNYMSFLSHVEKYSIFAVFMRVYDFYMSLTGSYFFMLINSVSAYFVAGYAGLRLELFLIALLFFVSCTCLTRAFVKYIGLPEDVSVFSLLFLLSAGLAYLLGTNELNETFYWHIGTCAYIVPTSMTLFCVYFYLKYKLGKKTRYLILGSLFAIMGAGGSLNITASLCAILLFGILYDFIVLKKIDLSVIIGAMAFVCALVNALAPGNFNRNTMYSDTGMNIGRAPAMTFARTGYVLFTDFRGGILFALLMLMFLYGYRYLKESTFEFKYPGLVSLYGIFAVFITDFPMMLGYNMQTYIINSTRATFVEHVTLTVFAIFIALYWGGWAAKRQLFTFTKTSLFIIALVTLTFLAGPYAYDTFMDFTPYKMAVHILNGDFKEIADKDASIIRQITESPNEDVIVYYTKDRPGQWVNFGRHILLDWEYMGPGNIYCDYYGKNSITLEYTDGESN